jgi:hypothetical protein
MMLPKKRQQLTADTAAATGRGDSLPLVRFDTVAHEWVTQKSDILAPAIFISIQFRAWRGDGG